MQTTASTLWGIDWGTTHRRAYALNAQGECVRQHADDDGALACKGRFLSALEALQPALGDTPPLVVMSGMVGSALGWLVAPYVDASVALRDLPQHAVAVPESRANRQLQIVPGYCVRNAQGQPDVMRGEETQLLGAVSLGLEDGWFVLPGTHSKWVLLEKGHVKQLRTYLTGELFDVLRKQGTIAAAIGTEPRGEWDAAAFAQGVQAAAHGALSHLLFGVRARVVCGDLQASSASAYLSGLLIGHELHDVMGTTGADRTFHLIGSPALARIYQDCAAQRGLTCHVVDAEQAYWAALRHFQIGASE